MKIFFTKIKQAVQHVVAIPGTFIAAFLTFIEACNTLSVATQEHTASIDALHSTIKAVASNTTFLAAAKRRDLQRSGHPSEF